MTVAIAYPAWWRVPLGVLLAGLGERVGDCRGAVVLQSGVLLGFLFFWEVNYVFIKGIVCYYCMLQSML